MLMSGLTTTIHFQEHLAINMKKAIFAKIEHIPLIAQLEEKTFSHPWSESSLKSFFEGGSALYAICMENEELAIYCTMLWVLDEVQIINVATHEKYKKQGYAEAVIKLALDEAKRRNITTISLEVRESNAPAISLYEKYGFFIAGKRKDFYTDPLENALVMIKNID